MMQRAAAVTSTSRIRRGSSIAIWTVAEGSTRSLVNLRHLSRVSGRSAQASSLSSLGQHQPAAAAASPFAALSGTDVNSEGISRYSLDQVRSIHTNANSTTYNNGRWGGLTSFSTDAINADDTSNDTLKEMLQHLESEGLTTTDQYNEAIVGYAELGEPSKADELLFRMEKMAKSSMSKNETSGGASSSNIDMPDVDSYTAVIDSYLTQQAELEAKERGTEKRGDRLRAAERIDFILRRMERAASSVSASNESSSSSSSTSARSSTKTIAPTSHHYDAAVTAWSRCMSRDRPVHAIRGIPQRAQAVLERMEHLSLDRSSGVRPTVETYNKLIEAWGNSHEYAFAPLAQAVYERMDNGPAAHLDIRPNDRTIRTMLRVWAQSDLKTAAFHATGHLMRLQQLLEAGAEDMEPTLEDYLTVLHCWSKAEDKHAARRAQSMLKQMERLYMKRTSDVRPTVACYRYVLIAMSNSKLSELGPKADDLMARMEDRLLVADSACFGATIKVWSNSACHKDTKKAEPDAERADEVLQQMRDMYHRSSQIVVKPMTANYNDVIRAYSASKRSDSAARRAEELLDEMNKLGGEGDADVMPDADSYIFTMKALAQSRLPDKVPKAKGLLKQMIERHQASSASDEAVAAAKPTVDCYHALVKVCASSGKGTSIEEGSSALRTAISTIKLLKESEECNANPETYRLLIEACGKLLPAGVDQVKALETIFKTCCRDGLVDDKVLKQFKKAAPFDLYQSTIVLKAKTTNDADGMILPEEWTRNIGHKIRTAEGRRTQLLSPDVGFVVTPNMVDYKMRRLRSKKNQRLLRGGRSFTTFQTD